jgi:hypothetical protein
MLDDDFVEAGDILDWNPSDEVISVLIRRLRGWPSDTPIPARLISDFRTEIWSAVRKKMRASRRREASPINLRGYRRRDLDILLDLMCEPHSQLLIVLLAGSATYLADHMTQAVLRVAENTARFRPDPALQVSGILNYLRKKLLVETRTPRITSSESMPPSPWHLAAINALSETAAREWEARLTEVSSMAVSVPAPRSDWLSSTDATSTILAIASRTMKASARAKSASARAAIARRQREDVDAILARYRLPQPTHAPRPIDDACDALEAVGRDAVSRVDWEMGLALCSPETGPPRGLIPYPPVEVEPELELGGAAATGFKPPPPGGR